MALRNDRTINPHVAFPSDHRVGALEFWDFGAGLLSLLPYCLRLARYITATHPRLASNAVVSSLFDRISTCRIVHPWLDARPDPFYMMGPDPFYFACNFFWDLTLFILGCVTFIKCTSHRYFPSSLPSK